MKLYLVKRGTKGRLIDLKADKAKHSQDTAWTVRRDCEFTDTVIDPIHLHNRPNATYDPLMKELANNGYAVFADWDNQRYLLAVKYNEVEILC